MIDFRWRTFVAHHIFNQRSYNYSHQKWQLCAHIVLLRLIFWGTLKRACPILAHLTPSFVWVANEQRGTLCHKYIGVWLPHSFHYLAPSLTATTTTGQDSEQFGGAPLGLENQPHKNLHSSDHLRKILGSSISYFDKLCCISLNVYHQDDKIWKETMINYENKI